MGQILWVVLYLVYNIACVAIKCYNMHNQLMILYNKVSIIMKCTCIKKMAEALYRFLNYLQI